MKVIPSRLSILTKSIENDAGRGACFFCGQCSRNCSVAKADFSSTNVLIYPALKTGNIDVVANAMAREVLTNTEGLATGVSYVSKDDLQEYQVEGYEPFRMGVIMGVTNLVEVFDEKYYRQLNGGMLEAFGIIFSRDLKIYVYPSREEENDEIMTTANMPVHPRLKPLYDYLLFNKRILRK